MKLQHRWVVFALFILSASLTFAPATSRAQLVPPGDFRGKSQAQWGVDWSVWGLRTGLGGESLPNIVDGAYFIPFSEGLDFEIDVTIQPGTPVVFSPFVLFGERYADGTEDDPVALRTFIDEEILGPTTVQTTFDGTVVLDGPFASFPERTYDITLLSPPVTYAAPNTRFPAVQAFWVTGLTAIFDDLSPGEHTIVSVYNSPFFDPDDPFVATYNITVIPEPSTLCSLGIGALGLLFARRRKD